VSEAILFKKCLGYTDSSAVATQSHNPETGETQLIGCTNTTVTDDGAVEKAPALSTVYTHSAPLNRVSAGTRLLFDDGTNIYEYVGGVTPVATRFPVLDGPIIHTPIDVRVSGATKNYKSVNPTGVMTELTVGTNPGPATSVAYEKMPVCDGGFVYNAKLYTWKGKFIQYSEDYHYDLWDIGNSFVSHLSDVRQAGAVPNVLLVAHDGVVISYVGSGPADFAKKFYPCPYINKTLFSGFISKALGYGHVFMADDGIYMVDQNGQMVRLTDSNLEYADTLNTSYTSAIVSDGKYLAFGNSVCVEYDFRTKAVMLRPSGVAAATVQVDTPYLAYGSTMATISSSQNSAVASSVTIPYAYLGTEGRKSFSDLYFTGELTGDLEIVCRDQSDPEEPIRWTIEAADLGVVQNKRIKLPRGVVGSKVSFQFNALAGSTFRMEEARVVFDAGNRR